MSQSPHSSAKICTRCSIDVSHKKRVKDPAGRYYCEDCYAKLTHKAGSSAPGQTTSGAPHGQATKHQSSAAAPAPGSDDEIMFELDPGPASEPSASEDVLLPAGYDPKLVAAATAMQSDAAPTPPSNQYLKQAREKEAKGNAGKYKTIGKFTCRHCGYDMSGAPSLRCPECGKMNMTPKDDALKQTERDVRVQMYRRPLILVAIGMGLSMLILTLAKAGSEKYVGLVAAWLVSIPISVLTFWVSTLIFLEYDAPWHVTALRLAGVNACVYVVDAISIAIGINAFGLVAIGLLLMLYITELELDKWEAVAMAVVGFVVKIGLGIAFLLVFTSVVGTLPLGGGGGGAPAPGPAVPLVSKSNPNGPVYIDADSNRLDDVTGVPVPADAVPLDSLTPAPDPR